MRHVIVCVVIGLGLLSAVDARAQGDRQAPGPGPDSESRDFLFGRPKASVGVRGNWLFARANSDWYSFVTDQLTLNRKDFNAPGFAFDVGLDLGRRADAVIAVDFNRTTKVSEYRHFVDNNRLPINQTTQLQTVGLTGSLKYALTDRGLEVSRLAYVPRGVIPYVGAGGGVLHYHLEQFGDFIDFVDSSVFGSTFTSAGWAPLAQAFAGVDVRVLKRVYVTLDARYQWSHATLGSTWIDFDPIDLAGFKLAAGANLVF
jgi:hypothetical protein